MAQYAPCPNCSCTHAQPVGFSWWGGVLGPKLMTHVKCEDCGTAYNGNTGRLNTAGIAIYLIISGIIGLAVVYFLLF